MNEKTIRIGKYIVTITTNTPSTEALQNFDKKVMKMSDNQFANHSKLVDMVA